MPGLGTIKLIFGSAAAGALLIGLVWIVDWIGDHREAKVRAEYAAGNKKLGDALLDVGAREEALAYRDAIDMDAAVKRALELFAKQKTRCVVDEEKAAIYRGLVKR